MPKRFLVIASAAYETMAPRVVSHHDSLDEARAAMDVVEKGGSDEAALVLDLETLEFDYGAPQPPRKPSTGPGIMWVTKPDGRVRRG